MPFQLKVSSVVFGEGPLCCESNLQMRCEGYGPYTYIGICLWPLPLALPLACAFDLCSLPSPLDLPFARGFRRCLPWPLPLTSAFALGLLPWVVAVASAVGRALGRASGLGLGLCRWPSSHATSDDFLEPCDRAHSRGFSRASCHPTSDELL